MKLIAPPEETPETMVERAKETAHFLIAQSLLDMIRLDRGDPLPSSRATYKGEDFDRGYAQGRKDALRLLLIDLGDPAAGGIDSYSTDEDELRRLTAEVT